MKRKEKDEKRRIQRLDNINPNLKENINYKFKISTKGKFYKLSNLCRNNNYNY